MAARRATNRRPLHPRPEIARLQASSSIRSCSGPARASRGAGASPIAHDVSSAATSGCQRLPRLGRDLGHFTPDSVNLTVAYSGPSFDWTYRRMILHYANLCVVAGGVDLFVIGSELRGLETIRGPAWTKAGNDGRLRLCGLGLSVRRRRSTRSPTTSGRRSTAPAYTKNSDDAGKPHHLFGRLVELDGLAAPGRKRPVAASRFALGLAEHRPRRLRQLSAADRLDDGRRRDRRDGQLDCARAAPAPGRRPRRP